MESNNEHEEPHFPKPSNLFNKLVFLQADLIYNALVFLFSPISTSLSLLSEAFHRTQETKYTVESAAQKLPSNIAYSVALLLKKLSYGFLAAALVFIVMLMLLVAAAVVCGVLMWVWVEEPVAVREKLYFDYTVPHPKAVFGKKRLGIPVGHTFCVSLVLFLPESDFNRQVGVFQLSATLLSTEGDVITSSTQPCMLRFRSTPIQITRTFLLSLPLLFGSSSESQKLTLEILNHKELNHQRTATIQVSLIPRIGTSALPELYEAQILINSQLPWTKELLHRWKWTCFLWISLYLYLLFLAILLFFCRSFFFPVATMADSRRDPENEEGEESRDEMEEITAELLRKWREIRRKRKATIFAQGEMFEENVASSVSSISFGREYVSPDFDDDIGDSESVCLEGSEG